MNEKFRIGLTRDFLSEKGTLVFKDIGLSVLDAEPRIEYEFLDEYKREVAPEQIQGYDGIISLAPRFTRATFEGADRLTAIGRFGVGYEMIDLEACTDANVMLFITPEAVKRPVAESILTWMLMLSKKAVLKDQLVRQGHWQEKVHHNGTCLGDRVLGSVGFGGIAGELFRLVQPFGMARLLAYDPYGDPQKAEVLGVDLVELDDLLHESDFIAINCPLMPETHHLIGEREFGLMKPTTYFINTARGPIVDQRALYNALSQNRIAGAGIDVFEEEPPSPDEPLFALDNVILAPHAIAWTDEIFRDNGRYDCEGIVKVMHGEIPEVVVNKAVLEKLELHAKLQAYRARFNGSAC